MKRLKLESILLSRAALTVIPDHAFSATTHGWSGTPDALNGTGNCGKAGGTQELIGLSGRPVAGRRGPGTRHVFVTRASISQFTEDNWLNGERLDGGSLDATAGSSMDTFNFNQVPDRKLFLDPTLGTVIKTN